MKISKNYLQLNEIPEDCLLEKLKILELNDNKLTYLPNKIRVLINLEILSLNRNKITIIDEIGNLKELRELYLNQNFISSLSNSICNLKRLQILSFI